MIETVIRNDLRALLDLSQVGSSAECASMRRLADTGLVAKRGRRYKLSAHGKRFIEGVANTLHALYAAASAKGAS